MVVSNFKHEDVHRIEILAIITTKEQLETIDIQLESELVIFGVDWSPPIRPSKDPLLSPNMYIAKSGAPFPTHIFCEILFPTPSRLPCLWCLLPTICPSIQLIPHASAVPSRCALRNLFSISLPFRSAIAFI